MKPNNDYFFGSLGLELSEKEQKEFGKKAYSVIEKRVLDRMTTELTPADKSRLQELSAKADSQERDAEVLMFFMGHREKIGKLFMQEAEKYRKELEALVADVKG